MFTSPRISRPVGQLARKEGRNAVATPRTNINRDRVRFQARRNLPLSGGTYDHDLWAVDIVRHLVNLPEELLAEPNRKSRVPLFCEPHLGPPEGNLSLGPAAV